MSERNEVSKTADQQPARNGASLMPPVDVVEDASGITLFAHLPGVPKDKLNLQVEADMLTIEGDVAIATPEGLEASYAQVG